MRFGVGVRFTSPDSIALVGRANTRSRVLAASGGQVVLAGKVTTRQASRPGLGSVPVITSNSFSIATNPGFNALIGTVLATNNPTSFAITSGNGSGFFAIAANGALRTGASAAPTDNNYSLAITATNSFGTSAPKTIAVTVGAIPAVGDQTFSIQIPATAGTVVGNVVVTAGTPTSYAITAGNASGFFAVNSTGDITVTSAGESGLTAQTYSLTVQATNALGSSTGSISVVASASAPAQADFRSVATVAYSARTNTTVVTPTGTVDGDILIAEVFIGNAGAVPTLTPPAGWTAIGTNTSVAKGGFTGQFHMFWKRASTEGANYVFTHASASTQVSIASYSGCVTTGSPIGAISSNTGTASTTTTATGITTTANNSRVLFAQHGWDISSFSPPAGMTERFESLIYLADYLAGAVGATGSKTGTVIEAPWAARLVELKSGSTVPIAPAVSDQSFNITTPATSGAQVGIVATSGGTPTSFSITAGNSAGYFVIDNNGSITVTSAGASGITVQTYALTVQATNSVGSGSGTVSVVASAPSAIDIPLSFNDPMFTGMTSGSGATMTTNQTITRRSVVGADSGLFIFNQTGAATLSYCRMTSTVSNDCDVLTQVADNIVNVDHCFIDNNIATNPTATHVDGFQLQLATWDPTLGARNTPSGGTINLSNTMIIVGGNDVTAGMFCADAWHGTINLTNVVIQVWAQYGLKINADSTGNTTVNMNNVFFDVRGGVAGNFLNFGGKVVVVNQWNNIRRCTVNNGVLTLGAAIAQPTPTTGSGATFN